MHKCHNRYILDPRWWEETMRKSIVVLAAASMFATASAATAQVTGIRHIDGSWTFVDANGRDIHKDRETGTTVRPGHPGARHDAASMRRRTTQRDGEKHKVTGYLPWLSR
jgi:hypothetical protein